ncbi:MAG: pilus assembly PilX N-terminal domain-containing protein [Patescibacteria group bacterium]
MADLKKKRKLNDGLKERGVSLYLTVMILIVLLTIGLMIANLLIGQLKIIKSMGQSMVAFYAADTGIERIMRKLYIEGWQLGDSLEGSLGAPEYKVETFAPGPDCLSPNEYFCIKSVGFYYGARRSIEVSR